VGALLVWTLKDLRECIEIMTSDEVKMDFICFIEGKRGLGKSTLGYKILSPLKIELPFRPKRDLVYTREDTIKHLANKINGCIFSDEMINVAYKRDFYLEDQKELLKGFDMYRDSRNVFIGCIPQFIDLDVKMQQVCKLRLTVVRRGIALVQMKMPTIYSADPWDIKNNQRIEGKWALKNISKPKYGQLTTVRGILRFGDLHPDSRKLYDTIKAEKRSHVFAKYQSEEFHKDPEHIWITNLYNEIKIGKMTKEQMVMLCRISGKKYSSVRNQINHKLREDNNPRTFKDYCVSEVQKRKRDILGFKQPHQVLMEESTNTKDEDTLILNPTQEDSKHDDSAESEDILGFEQ